MGNFGDCAPQRAVTLIRKSCRSDESLKTSVVAGVFSFLDKRLRWIRKDRQAHTYQFMHLTLNFPKQPIQKTFLFFFRRR